MPKRFSGYHVGCLVLIRPDYKEDEGLIQHELTHVKQNVRTLGWSGIKQIWNKNHKLNRECEAYAEQLKYVPAPLCLKNYPHVQHILSFFFNIFPVSF